MPAEVGTLWRGLQDMAAEAEHGAQTRQRGRELLPVRHGQNWEAHPS